MFFVHVFILSWALGLVPIVSATSCGNNCARAFRSNDPQDTSTELHNLDVATSFCQTFTKTIVTAATNLPPFATATCSNDVNRVSAACSCLPTPVPTSPACQQLLKPLVKYEVETTGSDPGTYPVANTDDWTFQSFDNNDGNGGLWYQVVSNENDDGPPDLFQLYSFEGPKNVFFDLSQPISRCVGTTYELAFRYDREVVEVSLDLEIYVGGLVRHLVPHSYEENIIYAIVPPLTSPVANDAFSIQVRSSGEIYFDIFNITLTAVS